ncbi:MAG: hypothetical protein M1820_009217 [Bogoriella megaspora]|nr:MAG: hypothetical protein M1820_009217 [Bogoriella megaspora]
MSASSESNTSAPELTAQAVPGAYPELPEIQQPQTLAQAVHARRSEYTRPSKIKIKVGSWNVASCKGTEKDVGGWFVGGKGVSQSMADLSIADSNQIPPDTRESVSEQEDRATERSSTIPKNDPGCLPHDEEIGIYALGLQEVIDVNSKTEALRPYTDPTAANKWKKSLEEALPKGYQLVAEQQLIGLLLLIYASKELTPEIKHVSTTSVGTGVLGYMGNKGAVTARIVLGDTTRMVFINSHLSAGADKAALDRRDWDASQIVSRTRFSPINDPITGQQGKGETIGEEDFAFWFGDLNYRLEGIPGEDVRRLLMLHTRNEYDLSQHSKVKIEKDLDEMVSSTHQRQHSQSATTKSSNTNSRTSTESQRPDNQSTHSSPTLSGIPSSDTAFETDPESTLDPTSLQATLASLLPHDELHQRQKARKSFHDGWREGEITFLPTYKYDVGSVGVFDSSEKKRAPSWCDRILYRTRRDKMSYESMIVEEEASRKRDEQLKAEGIDTDAADEDTLFEYNPETDADSDEDEDENIDDRKAEVVNTKAGFEDQVSLDIYTAHQRVLSSDHKPLDAVFSLKYDAVVPHLKAEIYQQVAKELDKAENEGRPTVSVVIDQGDVNTGSTNEAAPLDASISESEVVDFGDVRFSEPKYRTITIANTGRVPASVGFVDRPVAMSQKEGLAPEWLFVRSGNSEESKFQPPSKDLRNLEPGDAITIELLLQVLSVESVRDLNEGRTHLEDILVLRVSGGRDHFISVRGRWLQSSFGRSIDKLIRIPEGGIRKLQSQQLKGKSSSSDDPLASPVMWSAPRELFRLTESIEDLTERTVADWSMTGAEESGAAPPWKDHFDWPFGKESWLLNDQSQRDDLNFEIREALDNDQPFDEHLSPGISALDRLETLAETLLLFLESLEDGIISGEMWESLEAIVAIRAKTAGKKPLSKEDEKGWVLEILSSSPNRSVSFVLIMSTLARIAAEVSSSEPAGTLPSPLRSGSSVPSSPARSIREKNEISPSVRRTKVNHAYAEIFAKSMVRVPQASKSKGKKVQDDRMSRIIKLFLEEDDT